MLNIGIYIINSKVVKSISVIYKRILTFTKSYTVWQFIRDSYNFVIREVFSIHRLYLYVL